MILFYGLFLVLFNLLMMMLKLTFVIVVLMFIAHKVKFGKHATVKTFISRNKYRLESLFNL